MLSRVNSECLRACISTTPHIWNAKLSFLATLQNFCVINYVIFPSNHLLILIVLYYSDFVQILVIRVMKASIKTWKTHKKIHSLLPTTTRIIKLYYRLLEAILNFKFTEHHFPRLVKTWSLHKRITVKTHLFIIRYIATTSMISQYIYTTFTNIKKWVTHCLKADANQALILWYNRDRKALLLAWILLQNS